MSPGHSLLCPYVNEDQDMEFGKTITEELGTSASHGLAATKDG
jgi:ssRNA-specific RNase YbeY (16S rRNA maturation enzyme)